MRQKVDQLVPVHWVFKSELPPHRWFYPIRVYFRREWHRIYFYGFHHPYGHGKSLRHVFEVASDRYWFRLVFNPRSMTARLELVDG